MASDQISVFGDILDAVDSVLGTYVTDSTSQFIGEISPIAWGMFTLLIVLWGYAHWFGYVQNSIKDSTVLLVKSGIILGVALSVGFYQSIIMDTFLEAPEYFGSQVLYQGSSLTGVENTGNVVDEMMHQSGEIVRKLKDLAEDQGGSVVGVVSYPDFLLLGLAGVVWLLSISLGAIATLAILISKILLTVFLTIGPLFILALLFKSTQRYFDLWISALVNMVMLVVLAIGLLSIMFGVIDYYVSAAAEVPDEAFKVEDAITVVSVFALSVLLLSQVPQQASGLAGGVGVSFGNMISKLAGGGALSSLGSGAKSFRGGSKTFDANGNLLSRGQGGLGHRGVTATARGAQKTGQMASGRAQAAYKAFNPNSIKKR